MTRRRPLLGSFCALMFCAGLGLIAAGCWAGSWAVIGWGIGTAAVFAVLHEWMGGDER